MNKNFLGLLEAHVEKIVLGISVVGLGTMVYLFGIGSPNKVSFGNAGELAPADLSPRILDEAKGLQSAMARAAPEPDKNANARGFAATLKELQNNVLFAANRPVSTPDAKSPPALKAATVVTTVGGKPIAVPGLKEAEEINNSIELVTPLATTPPVVRTGRNLVERTTIQLGTAPRPADATAKPGEPVALSWVTVAAYFDKQNQQAMMHQAKYSVGRSRVYVAGVDVERQELLSNGEWSEWKPVENSKAMPEFNIPVPAIDDRGNLINKTELDEAWTTVKAEQQRIMEPPFYPVTAGAAWKMPALEGYEDPVDAADDAPKKPRVRKEREPRPSSGTRGVNPRGAAVNPRGGGGGFGGDVGVIGGGAGRGGRMVPGGGGGSGISAADKTKARKEASDKLKEAREAMSKKDYAGAISAAQQVTSNEYASAGDKRQAESIVEEAEKKQAEAAPAGPTRFGGGGRPGMAPGIVGDGFAPMGGPRGYPMPTAGAQEGPSSIVTHPDNKSEVAVWFHDDTVEPGKTYQYRMRVDLWNRYMGRTKAVKNPEDARKAVIEGEWSAPSDPVVVAPSTHFFVTSVKPGTEIAVVEVWKWRKGAWYKQNFEAAVGEMIGGEKEVKVDDPDARNGRELIDFSTGAVILDLRVEEPIQMRLPSKGGGYNLVDRKSLVLVYLDPADGQVKERIQDYDRADPIRKMLQAQEK